MKKVLVLAALAALVAPGAALADKPAGVGKASPNVQYILTGKLSAYDPATSTHTGSITIYVTSSNYRAEVVKGQALTFSLDPSTKISGVTTINDDDNGTLKILAAKDVSSFDLDGVLMAAIPSQVIDNGQ